MMTLERQMEYLRGRSVAKERPVTLSDFDQLLYEEHSLYQLFEYQGFLHQLSWTVGFCVDTVVQDFFCALVSVDRAPEVQLEVRGVQPISYTAPGPRPLLPAVPLTDEQRTSEQDLWTLMTGKTSAVVGSIIKQNEFWRILHLIWTPNFDGRTYSTECPFTRAQCMLLLGQQMQIDFSLYMFELIMDEA
ncbi:hypothetical protein CJ030_MR3G012007 [Morella rubra]|uniref:Uncharacterized protein n=1 Tax=Morella rubra TaxID=262757 RepID=A0A6A1W765_9ROSI|nr:hypothetical protein CJ030_MR3G012007 [Morella rubra]